MNKETGEVNEIFKLDFFFLCSSSSPPFFIYLFFFLSDRENYGGNFLHSRRGGAAACCARVHLFFGFFTLRVHTPLTPTSVHLYTLQRYTPPRTEIIEILLFGKITRVFSRKDARPPRIITRIIIFGERTNCK